MKLKLQYCALKDEIKFQWKVLNLTETDYANQVSTVL